MVGSMIGGYFSEPFGRVPVLSEVTLFRSYPYAAPGLLISGTSVLASAGVLLFVREVRGQFSFALELILDQPPPYSCYGFGCCRWPGFFGGTTR
jgi:hypothetical protein